MSVGRLIKEKNKLNLSKKDVNVFKLAKEREIIAKVKKSWKPTNLDDQLLEETISQGNDKKMHLSSKPMGLKPLQGNKKCTDGEDKILKLDSVGLTRSTAKQHKIKKSKRKSEAPISDHQLLQKLEGTNGDKIRAFLDSYDSAIDTDSSSDDEKILDGGLALTSRTEQRNRRKAEKERLSRTLFVGNLPSSSTKKQILRLFQRNLRENSELLETECTVESVRIRGAVPVTGGTSKQARKRASIQHDFAAGSKHTQIGFVVLSSKAGIHVSLRLNGYWIPNRGSAGSADGRHIRVDICSKAKSSYKPQASIFVGNLNFSTNEEQVRDAFAQFGEITNVRLVRDPVTAAVKGIGFVEFANPDVVSLALRASGNIMIGNRLVRIQPWKSIKKSKAANRHIGGISRSDHAFVSGSFPSTISDRQKAPSIVVPSNLHASKRKEFVRRRLLRLNKRKSITVKTEPPNKWKKHKNKNPTNISN